jgi:integrase
MKGTTIKYTPKRGRPTFGYTFFAGRDETGKRRQILRRGFATRAEAEPALRAAIEAHRKTPAPARTMPTFAEFFDRWHKEVIARAHSPKTAERSHELIQYAIKLFGSTPLDHLTSAQLTADVNRLLDHGGRVTNQHPQGKPLAPKTVRHIAFLVQACIQQAVDWDIVIKNPMKKVRKPKVTRRRPAVVDREGFERLLEIVAGLAIYPVIILAMATGMRRGELLALAWSDLDWERGFVEVSKSLEQTKQGLRIKSTKSGANRRFSIPGEALEVLREHKAEQEQHRALYGDTYANRNLVFARPDGEYYSPDKMGTRIRAAMKRAGLMGVSLHSLRHSHASELLSKGAPITAVSERLGHASPNITLSIYSHALPADNQAAAQLWNNSMAEVIQKSRKQAAKNRMSSNVIKTASGRELIVLESAR